MHGNRTLFRMQLEKERLELEKKREEDRRQKMMEAQKIQQSSSIEVPKGQPVPQVTVEVPPKVLEVRGNCSLSRDAVLSRSLVTCVNSSSQVQSQLQHPTNFHLESVRKNQLHQFLNSHGAPVPPHSAPAHNHFNASGSPSAMRHMPGMTSYSMQKDPLLSGRRILVIISNQQNDLFSQLFPLAGLTHSPIQQHSLGSSHNLPTTSPSASALISPGGGELFTMSNLGLKADSPTVMSKQTPDEVEQ